MGLIKDKIYYTYEDVTIMPNVISLIEHRSECIPLDEDGMLPLFTAPMDTVVNSKNFVMFEDEMIHAILPRTESLTIRVENSIKGRWSAYSLTEFEHVFCNEAEKLDEKNKIKALIDIANGHMEKNIELVRAAKNIYGDNIIIMVGNIANPKTYAEYARVGVDYIRIGIGSGCGCLSSSNTGIHMPMATLIDETVEVKKSLENKWFNGEYKKLPKIIADGGIRNYRDIIKALALGADAVMAGKIFAECEEACEPIYWAKSLESAHDKSNRVYEKMSDDGHIIYTPLDHSTNMSFDGNFYKFRDYYGMSSKRAQLQISDDKTKLKTSEGIDKPVEVKYPVSKWVDNMQSYLRSCMTYTNSHTIKELRENAQVIILGGSGDAAYRK